MIKVENRRIWLPLLISSYLIYSTTSSHFCVRSCIAEEASKIAAPRVDLYGDPLPQGVAARLGTIRFSPESETWAVALSPDGATLATGSIPGSMNGVVELWNSETGEHVARLFEGGQNITAIAWSPNGKQLAIARDYRLEVWNVDDRTKLFEIANEGAPKHVLWQLRWTQDGKWVVGVTIDRLEIWDTVSRTCTHSMKYDGELKYLDLSPDDSVVALAGKNFVDLRFLKDLTLNRRIHIAGDAQSVSFSPDGKHIAYCVQADKESWIGVANSANGDKEYQSQSFTPMTCDADFTSDGRIVVAATDKIGFWDLKDERIEFTSAHGKSFWYLSMSADRKRIATASHRAEIWDTHTGKPIVERPTNTGTSRGMWFSRDGKSLTTATGTTIRRWNTATGQMLNAIEWPEQISAMAVSPDEKQLAVYAVDGRLTLCDVTGREKITLFEGTPFSTSKIVLKGLAYSPDGRQLIAGCFDDRLREWDLTTNARLSEQTLFTEAVHLSYSPRGSQLAISFFEYDVQLWESTKLVPQTYIEDSGGILSGPFAFSPDGQSIAVSGPLKKEDEGYIATVRLLGCTKRSIRWESKPMAWVKNIAFSPNGLFIAVSGGHAKNVCVLSAKDGKVIKELPLDETDAPSIVFSPDSKLLATANVRGTVLLWDVSEMTD